MLQKSKVHFKGGQNPMPGLILCGDQLEVFDNFKDSRARLNLDVILKMKPRQQQRKSEWISLTCNTYNVG